MFIENNIKPRIQILKYIKQATEQHKQSQIGIAHEIIFTAFLFHKTIFSVLNSWIIHYF